MAAHFTPEALKFLRGLARHNDRDWFDPRKPIYEREIKAPMLALIDELNHALAEFAPDHVRPPHKAMMRIYRDTRFARRQAPLQNQCRRLVDPRRPRENLRRRLLLPRHATKNVTSPPASTCPPASNSSPSAATSSTTTPNSAFSSTTENSSPPWPDSKATDSTAPPAASAPIRPPPTSCSSSTVGRLHNSPRRSRNYAYTGQGDCKAIRSGGPAGALFECSD